MPKQTLLSMSAVASIHGVHVNTVRKRVARGYLKPTTHMLMGGTLVAMFDRDKAAQHFLDHPVVEYNRRKMTHDPV